MSEKCVGQDLGLSQSLREFVGVTLFMNGEAMFVCYAGFKGAGLAAYPAKLIKLGNLSRFGGFRLGRHALTFGAET